MKCQCILVAFTTVLCGFQLTAASLACQRLSLAPHLVHSQLLGEVPATGRSVHCVVLAPALSLFKASIMFVTDLAGHDNSTSWAFVVRDGGDMSAPIIAVFSDRDTSARGRTYVAAGPSGLLTLEVIVHSVGSRAGQASHRRLAQVQYSAVSNQWLRQQSSCMHGFLVKAGRPELRFVDFWCVQRGPKATIVV